MNERLFSVGLTMALLCACKQSIDLSAVTAIATLATTAKPTYAAITNDYYESCLRYNGWVLLATEGILTDPQGRSDMVLKAIPEAPPPPPGGPALQTMGPAELQKANDYIKKLIGSEYCDTAIRPAVDDWQHANDAVLGYLEALGRVAGGGKPTDFGFDALTGHITSLTKPQSKAISSFLDDLSNQIFNADRRNTIGDSAVKADQALGVVLDLCRSAATEYKKELARERGELNTFYSFNLGQPNVPIGIRRVGLVQYEVDWQSRLSSVDQKIAAADAYVKSLEAIRTAHADLAKNATAKTWEALYKTGAVFYSDFQPKVVAIAKTFK